MIPLKRYVAAFALSLTASLCVALTKHMLPGRLRQPCGKAFGLA